ncbi:MAG: peptidylprolyl isomerase [Paludibacteraceae bacterium]|nr:peptidylprolyl isomerase [Paludibacteraceae bacterium]
MKKVILSIILLAGAMMGFAQEDKVLMTINGEPVMLSEFLYIYEKNNQESSLEKKSMEEYLDLFINFKLKVAEAIAQGVDTTEAFKKELAGYRAQATPKYMQDNEAIDSLVQLSYNRQANVRRAAHIAIQCPANADSATIAAAEAKIQLARERVTTGVEKKVKQGRKWVTVREPEAFADVAREMTDDPAGKENGGELGWIQVFRFVYPFEEAVYNTPVGEVTEVFRSPYGLHIALVEEERAFEEVHAAHIMKMMPRGSEGMAIDAKKQIDSLYQVVLAGADFAEIATAHSDDKGSAVRGGDLGWFGRGMMVQPFENITFDMQPGEMSEPFPTRFGWHFVKLYEKRGIQPLDSMRQQLLNQVKRDVRYQEAEKSFINKTRAEYNLPAEMSNDEVKAYADAHLEEKYADLRNLVREYHDGILLFDVSLREVWDKANKDTEGLATFFKANKKNYTWETPRYKGYIIYAKDEKVAKAAKQIIKSANADSVMSYINQRVNVDSVQYVRVERGLWKEGKNAAVDKYAFKNKTAEYTPTEEFPVVIPAGKVIKAPEEYTDVRGQVTTDYQDHLEKLWVNTLHDKYPVEVNEEVLKALK